MPDVSVCDWLDVFRMDRGNAGHPGGLLDLGFFWVGFANAVGGYILCGRFWPSLSGAFLWREMPEAAVFL